MSFELTTGIGKSDQMRNIAVQPSQVDRGARISLRAQILLRRSGVNGIFVETTNISPTGCRVEFVDRPTIGDRNWIKFDGLEALESTVRWVNGFSAGIEFVRPIYPPVFELLVAKLL